MMIIEATSEPNVVTAFMKIKVNLREPGVLSGFIFPDE